MDSKFLLPPSHYGGTGRDYQDMREAGYVVLERRELYADADIEFIVGCTECGARLAHEISHKTLPDFVFDLVEYLQGIFDRKAGHDASCNRALMAAVSTTHEHR